MANAVRVDYASGLAFLPIRGGGHHGFIAELISSPAMEVILRAEEYECVIVDLPPVGPVVDARAISSKVDGFLFVIEWGKTTRQRVKDTLSREWMIAEKILGAVLTKVDTRKMRLYQADLTTAYYGGQYGYQPPAR